MSRSESGPEEPKAEIASQVAELSRLLGMIPSDDTIQLQEPLTESKMALSDWLGATRDSFLRLSLLISRELDIQLQ